MSWIIVALIAYFLLAGSAVLDKLILNQPIRSPIIYATYIGFLSAYAILALPLYLIFFDGSVSAGMIIRGLLSGVLNITALLFFYMAIKNNDVSRTTPFVGVFAAVFTLILGGLTSVEKIDFFEVLIFLILVTGAFLVAKLRFGIPGLLSAFFLALSIIVIKSVYQEAPFLPAFFLARIGDFLTGLTLFLIFGKRLAIRENWRSLQGKTLGWIGVGKAIVGSSLIVQHYAIFLGSAVLVQALSGIQYFFVWLIVLIASYFFTTLKREHFPHSTVIVIFGFVLLALSQRPSDLAPGVKEWGVTFSKPWAEQLGLDWKNTYSALLDDLGVRRLRVPAYWTEVEKEDDVYSFNDLDWQITEAEKRDAKVILAVGRRLPRWPECHIPSWARNYESGIMNQELLEYVEVVVNRYKDSEAILAWQVENEPFLSQFGICPPPDPDLLDQEIALVKRIDNRPVIVTDSGELGDWMRSAKRADIFGTTIYSVVWRNEWPQGYIRYPRMPSFFHFKANLIGSFKKAKDIIISELQAEPWGPGMIYELSPEEQQKSMNLKRFKKNVNFAKSVGFREAYLWGAEWWYQEKLQGRNQIWEYAKTLF